MIIVLADDLTGAAELAGMAHAIGLHTRLHTEPITDHEPDVVVYNTDSRSLPIQQALERIKAFHQVIQSRPGELIFKKTDSVLRGHIAKELQLQMELLKARRIFFLPGNPSLGRVIQNGKYYINGIALGDSVFAKDPEFPRTSSDVQILLEGPLPVHSISELSNEPGILVGDAFNTADVEAWAELTREETFLAGAGDFFQAVLENRFRCRTPVLKNTAPIAPFIFLAGTSLHAGKEEIWGMSRTDECVIQLTSDHLNGEGLSELEHQLKDVLTKYNKAIMAFSNKLTGNCSALYLRSRMTEILRDLVSRIAVLEIFVEGGSTAQALLEGWDASWMVDAVYGRGVIRLISNKQVIRVSMKPGSYPLADPVRQFLQP